MTSPEQADGLPKQAAELPGDESEGEVEELVELQLVEEAKLEQQFADLRRERGLDDDETLKVFFKLFDMWIQLYRLNKCSEVLQDVVPICRERGGQLHIKGVQALAFTVWKQSKFREAAALFHEIEKLVGASAALCENIGHTYSSLGEYDKAANYFKAALKCIDDDEAHGKDGGNRAGVQLGLGLIEDRRGNLVEALALVREARRLFRERANGKPSSLIAKAGMSIAKILLKLADQEENEEKRVAMEEEAIQCERENVEIFEVTCGDDSPLTSSALRGLGEALMRRGLMEEAQTKLAEAYRLEAVKDAYDLLSVMEVHNMLVNSHVKGGVALNRTAFKAYVPIVQLHLGRVKAMHQDGNAGAYYKAAGEMMAFAEDYQAACDLLGEAVALFKQEDPAKVDGLIDVCASLQAFCSKQIAAAAKLEAPRTELASDAAS